jgi:uncharacterized protein (TIGR02145 family)
VVSLLPIFTFAEGTKQIMPVDGGTERIHITQPQPQQFGFAWFDCPPEKRLHIHIKEVGEKIYYGFRKTVIQPRQYQIRDPNNNIVLGPVALPESGNFGYISTYAQAVAGPSQVAGPSGYDALEYLPLMTGDYSIEFEAVTTFLYFDITVVTASNVQKDGRIWSKSWQFSTGTNPGEFNGSLFVYSDDGIVTNLNLNGMQGIIFSLACNEVGCPDPNNPGGYTRKSVNGQFVIPQYKIFVSNPDSTVYPTGTYGQISNLLITWLCDGTALVTFNATQSGVVDILFDINPLPGKQPEDVLLSQSVVAGGNSVSWNGMNGLPIPQPVTNGTVFNVIVTYINGLTNFPVYDVEQNANGFIVSLIRPPGPVPNLFWDDLDLVVDPLSNCGLNVPPLPTANYAGCPGNTGCHTWLSVGSGNPSQCSFPNRNTANTYWYAAFSTSTLPSFEVHRVPFPPEVPSGPSDVCPGELQQTYSITPEVNSTIYQWEYTGTGAIFQPANPTGLTATLDFGPGATSGSIRVRGWNSNCGYGQWSSKPVMVNPNPVPTISGNSTVCGASTQEVYFTQSGMINYIWSLSGGGNIISGGGATDDSVIISWNTPGTFTLSVLFTDGLTGCTASVPAVKQITVSSLPTLTNTPLNSNICNGQNTNIVLTSGSPGTLFTWTAEGSSPQVTGFSDNTSNPTTLINQTLFNSGSVNETVVYHITPEQNGCLGQVTNYTVLVSPVPNVSFTPNGQIICSSQMTSITLQSGVAGCTFTWTATGSSPEISGYSNNSGGMIQQVLSNSGYIPGNVTYSVTPAVNGCMGNMNTTIVIVNPKPVVSFPACFDTLTTTAAKPITLKGSTPSGGTYSGAGIAGNKFYPNLAGAGVKTITYSVSNGYTCTAVKNLKIVVVNPANHICGNPLTDIRDNQIYTTVSLGGNCWMASNLSFGTMITSVKDQRDNCTNEKYCFGDNLANCTQYGGLYQWDEFMLYGSQTGSQGFCPPGWHIPAETEWNALFIYYGSSAFAGNPLKFTGFSGFNAYLSGIRFHSGAWRFSSSDPVLCSILFWSSDPYGTTKAWSHGLNYVVNSPEFTPSTSHYPALRSNAFAIRCVKD